MSATLQRPAPAPPPAAPAPAPAGDARDDLLAGREGVVLVATLALLAAACAPLARVYVGLDFLRPVVGAVLLAVALGWGARRFDCGPLLGLAVSALGWAVFCATAFLADTLWAGVVPTAATVQAGVDLWRRGVELMQVRPAPAFAEAGLLFITTTGVWAVAHAVEGLVFRLRSPLKAVAMALLLWLVPLSIAPQAERAWPWALPMAAAAALLLFAHAGADLGRWGAWVPRPGGARRAPLAPSGAAIAISALVAGTLLAGLLPGFGEPPWYELRGLGGTTLTTNPIVDIRTRLVASDRGPVLRVRSDRPVYLRTTSLDIYGSGEEWTNAGIKGAPLGHDVPFETAIGPAEQVRVDVQVVDLPQAVLVPAPYQALSVGGPAAEAFQYDQRLSTITLDRGVTLQPGDEYAVTAALPAPDPTQLDAVSVAGVDPRLTALPPDVPPAVAQLAAEVVARAGARTAFQQALALQQELRSWTYSTEPPQGHSGRAMEAFLASRIGYCEQFAGTMAVMLRTLGIPARVAVGYTPGRLVDPEGTYVVSDGNAHAWVEVLFPGYGWVTFEPTPRSDGNVLVPSVTSVAPSRTARPAQFAGELPDPPPITDEREQQLLRDPAERPQAELPPQAAAGGGGLASSGGRVAGAALVLLAVALAGAGLARRRRRAVTRPPAEQVLAARAAVERVGRGLRRPPSPSETDREYLARLAAPHAGGAVAAERLAAAAARARYAQRMPPAAAAQAQAAAATLLGVLRRSVPWWRRPLVAVRGRVGLALAGLAARRAGATPGRRRAGGSPGSGGLLRATGRRGHPRHRRRAA